MERSANPGETWFNDYNVLWSGQTQDGQVGLICRRHGEGEPGRIVLKVGDSLTWFPKQIVERLGDDDLPEGMMRMAAALETLDYSNVQSDQEPPIMTDFVYPFFDGADMYREVVLLHQNLDILARQPAG